MHELSITQNIVSIVAEAAGGHPVRRVTLEVGKLSGVMLDAIVFCFDVVAKGTPVEGAKLEIHEVDGVGKCLACNNEFPMPTLFTRCPCGSRRITRLKGEELKVRTMELEIG